jgi:hypothetical protein
MKVKPEHHGQGILAPAPLRSQHEVDRAVHEARAHGGLHRLDGDRLGRLPERLKKEDVLAYSVYSDAPDADCKMTAYLVDGDLYLREDPFIDRCRWFVVDRCAAAGTFGGLDQLAQDVVGKPLNAANARIRAAGYTSRVARRNGLDVMRTADIDPRRLNLAVDRGLVTKAWRD